MKYLSSKAVVMGAVALAASDPLGGGVSASAGEGSYLETFTVESFSSGWSYSNGEKYTGRFAVETIVEGTDDTGLKVRICHLLDLFFFFVSFSCLFSFCCLPWKICLLLDYIYYGGDVGDEKGAALWCGHPPSKAG